MAGAAPTRRRRGLVHKAPLKLGGPKSEINVTPLVDVCLVLLIIFMVIMPLLARGKEVPLPRTKHHTQDSDKNQPIVAIARDGKVFFDKEHITDVVPSAPPAGQAGRRWEVKDPDRLRRTLTDAWTRAEEQRAGDQASVMHKVFVKADKDIAYGQIYPLIMVIHGMGVAELDLGTNEIIEGAAGGP